MSGVLGRGSQALEYTSTFQIPPSPATLQMDILINGGSKNLYILSAWATVTPLDTSKANLGLCIMDSAHTTVIDTLDALATDTNKTGDANGRVAWESPVQGFGYKLTPNRVLCTNADVGNFSLVRGGTVFTS